MGLGKAVTVRRTFTIRTRRRLRMANTTQAAPAPEIWNSHSRLDLERLIQYAMRDQRGSDRGRTYVREGGWKPTE